MNQHIAAVGSRLKRGTAQAIVASCHACHVMASAQSAAVEEVTLEPAHVPAVRTFRKIVREVGKRPFQFPAYGGPLLYGELPAMGQLAGRCTTGDGFSDRFPRLRKLLFCAAAAVCCRISIFRPRWMKDPHRTNLELLRKYTLAQRTPHRRQPVSQTARHAGRTSSVAAGRSER